MEHAASPGTGAAGNEPSACEKECSKQQDALTACMNAIRDAREVVASGAGAGETNDDDGDVSRVDTSCLAPAVASWTECCALANNGAVESNEGHIGIG
ncbi:unnamed protein product [Pseudo-nitzschia multistriata]|uniref:Uncharacterized protein n=1 Tax=Pseudo-nitzschia multistriata TaxID=183589 RepID=A0A448ZL25_9STRA|nr:unnamed protein product [Pseudo-nitzschia multistriata]